MHDELSPRPHEYRNVRRGLLEAFAVPLLRGFAGGARAKSSRNTSSASLVSLRPSSQPSQSFRGLRRMPDPSLLAGRVCLPYRSPASS